MVAPSKASKLTSLDGLDHQKKKKKLTSRVDYVENKNPTWNHKFIFAINKDLVLERPNSSLVLETTTLWYSKACLKRFLTWMVCSIELYLIFLVQAWLLTIESQWVASRALCMHWCTYKNKLILFIYDYFVCSRIVLVLAECSNFALLFYPLFY